MLSNMSLPIEEYPREPGERPSVDYETLARLDMSATDYSDTCADYASQPTEDSLMAITTSASVHLHAFQQVLNTLDVDATPSAYRRMVATVMFDQDTRRVDTLNFLLGDEVLERIRSFSSDTAETTENPEDIVGEDAAKALFRSAVASFYSQALLSDTNAFVTVINTTEQARRLALRRTIMRRTIDIGKMALGPSIGISAFLGKFVAWKRFTAD